MVISAEILKNRCKIKNYVIQYLYKNRYIAYTMLINNLQRRGREGSLFDMLRSFILNVAYGQLRLFITVRYN